MTSRLQLQPGMLLVAWLIALPAAAVERSQTPVKETGKASQSREATSLSATARARASVWGLSETEWHRYTQLMQGIRGSISPSTLSPVEVLGIHARDTQERERYAEIWARMLYDDADRVLAFQRAYDAAIQRLYPNELLIDRSRLAEHTETHRPFHTDDRLLFFTRPDCPACDALMNKLLARIDEVSGIDVFLTEIDEGNDAAVRAWAARHRMNPDWVRSRRITLNHDGGLYARLTRGETELPTVLRRRGEDLSQLRSSDF